MYPAQDASRMGTARVKQEEEIDTKIIVVRNLEERNVDPIRIKVPNKA